MPSFRHNCLFILLFSYYWLLVSASKDHHQANIYKNLKMMVHIVEHKIEELYMHNWRMWNLLNIWVAF